MSETMVERVRKAIDAVQIWSRFNDWTSDRVEGLPVEICRYGKDGEDEIVVLKRVSSVEDAGGALREVVSEMRARAAIEALHIEQMVINAYVRGVEWNEENPLDREYRFKAAGDYADAALSSSTRGE